MAVQLSTLSNIPNDATLVTGQVVASAEHNAHRTALETQINNYLTSLRDNENNYASGSAPADKPAGKLWWDSTNSLLKVYKTLGGTPQPIVLLDGTAGTQTIPNTGAKLTSGAAVSTPASGFAQLASLSTDDAGNVSDTPYFAYPGGGRLAFGLAANKVMQALAWDISASQAAGTTFGTTLSETLKANSLRGVAGVKGTSVLIFAIGSGDGTHDLQLTLNSVLIAPAGAVAGPHAFFSLVTYIDATHCNIFSLDFCTLSGLFSQNTGGFTNGTDQTIALGAASGSSTYQITTIQLG